MNEKHVFADMDFIESRRFFRDEICKAFCMRSYYVSTAKGREEPEAMTTQLENKSPVTLMGRPIVYSDTIDDKGVDSVVFGDFMAYKYVKIPVFTYNMFNRFCKLMKAKEFNLLEFAEFCRQYDDSITDLQARKILKTLEHANIIKYTGLLHFKKV